MAALNPDKFRGEAVRIALSSGLTRQHVAVDMGVGHFHAIKMDTALSPRRYALSKRY